MAFKDNKKFYDSSIKKYGISAQGVHWNNQETQYKRFEIITQLISKDFHSNSFVDVGCGFADYYRYLEENDFFIKEYIGIDCEKDMINVCKERFPKLDFLEKNALKDELAKKDYYICSGALNILTKKEFFLFIKNCYKASNRAFIFNFLSKDSYNHLTKDEVITFCKTLSTNTKIVGKYLYNDTTIIIYK